MIARQVPSDTSVTRAQKINGTSTQACVPRTVSIVSTLSDRAAQC
jgi:hypothetical protein